MAARPINQAVDAVSIFIAKGFFRAVDVAVAENRDGDVRLVFDFSDIIPIGFAFIHLLAGFDREY